MYQAHRSWFWRSVWWTQHSNAPMALYAFGACSVFHFAGLESVALP